MTRRRILGMGTLVVATIVVACSGGGSPSSPSSSGGSSSGGSSSAGEPVATTTITITSAGASPRSITVAPGSRVTFVNNDSQSHDMTSDPHPEHTTCPELNSVGFLQAGQSRTSGNLNTVRTCGYHDHSLPNVATLQGTIRIQ